MILLFLSMGGSNFLILMAWQCVYVLPNWQTVIENPQIAIFRYRTEFKNPPIEPEHAGTIKQITICFIFLFVAGLFVRGATMYLLKQLGAVTFVILKMLKIGRMWSKNSHAAGKLYSYTTLGKLCFSRWGGPAASPTFLLANCFNTGTSSAA